MAILTNNNPTYLDYAKSLDPNGQVATVIELLNETNEILADITAMEGNLETGHRTVVRTGLPVPTWRRFYGGVQPTKSNRAQITDTCGMMEAYSEVDKALADLNGNTSAFRLSEARAELEGMSQSFAETLFYGNTSINPERFDGLAPRYSDLSADIGDNIIDAGGTGADNRSIWLVVWGPNTCHGIYPKGSQGGIQVNDKGQVTIEDASNGSNTGRMEGYRMHFRMDAGLCLKDWRYVVRIANIDKSDLRADAATGANLPGLMFEALELIPNLNSGRPVFYMSRDVRTVFRQQLSELTKNSTLTYENVGGHRTAIWNEVPLRRCDVLATDEARVV